MVPLVTLTAVADGEMDGEMDTWTAVADGASHLLRPPPEDGIAHGNALEQRKTATFIVEQTNEVSGCLLIGVRTALAESMQPLDTRVWEHKEYTKETKAKEAIHRVVTCQISYRQNIGHIGKEFVVTAVHAHAEVMKMQWRHEYDAFWNYLAEVVIRYKVKFLAGDFNMVLTQVIKELRKRNIPYVDCIAWYPWRHKSRSLHNQRLGFDSMGIFYIGGNVKVDMPWSLKNMNILTAVADDEMDVTLTAVADGEVADGELHEYDGETTPGQPWQCYRSVKFVEKDAGKNLRERLEDLLTPSTTPARLQFMEERAVADRGPLGHCPYLRIKQKKIKRESWLVDNAHHGGSHHPLLVFTKNAGQRSAEAAQWRRERGQLRWQNRTT